MKEEITRNSITIINVLIKEKNQLIFLIYLKQS